MIDIGGGTSDIAVFKGGAIRHTAVLPIAGDQVTNDISVAFRTPIQSAEEIKLKYGCALPQLVQHQGQDIEVPSVGESPPRHLSRLTLAEVIQPRYHELFRFIRKELHRSDWYDGIAGGLVLTGGAALIPGVVELAEEVFELPVRVGLPQAIAGARDIDKSPAFATAAGLLTYAQQMQPKTSEPIGDRASYWWGRLNSWFKGNL